MGTGTERSVEWLAGYNAAVAEALEEFKGLHLTTMEASQAVEHLQTRIAALGE